MIPLDPPRAVFLEKAATARVLPVSCEIVADSDTPVSAFEKTLEVNLRGYFYMSVEAGKRMREQGSGGSIVNVASANGITPGDKQAVYSMTKAAILNMTQAFANECGQWNIRVNALVPGLLKTCRDGYDGKGQRAIASREDLECALAAGNVRCVLERKVKLAGELSVILARSDDGRTAVYPPALNRHEAGVLDLSVVPLASGRRMASLATVARVPGSQTRTEP